ncbi:hypothetical protein [Haloterrigena alkaliphila]|uniref:C2H2-type domain-containing protein n=1 Tax=Haloterrigena alkaliphila TaxID=2816475 RepID=A0A8A2VI36_9EURY|nr:hypothetical protein [Haloterrigena alkaliphila]QSX00318.1 hypothetical protein J0X25_04960 [Haloterrigena alkaliphila]
MANDPQTCPICEFSSDAETDVYTHLLTSHRKRAITETLLEVRPAHAPQR